MRPFRFTIVHALLMVASKYVAAVGGSSISLRRQPVRIDYDFANRNNFAEIVILVATR